MIEIFVSHHSWLGLVPDLCLPLNKNISAHPHKRNISEWCVFFHCSLGPWRASPQWAATSTGSLLCCKAWNYSLDKARAIRLASFVLPFSAITVLHCLMSSVWENSSFISLVWFYFILVIWGRRYLWFLLFHSSFMEMKVSPIFRAESYTLHIPYVLADATSLGSQM